MHPFTARTLAAAFAAGTCAGAVAVIPGTADGSVADSDVPTVFAPVDDLEPCTARAAIEALAAR